MMAAKGVRLEILAFSGLYYYVLQLHWRTDTCDFRNEHCLPLVVNESDCVINIHPFIHFLSECDHPSYFNFQIIYEYPAILPSNIWNVKSNVDEFPAIGRFLQLKKNLINLVNSLLIILLTDTSKIFQ